MWVAAETSWMDFPCASRAERSASPMVLRPGHLFCELGVAPRPDGTSGASQKIGRAGSDSREAPTPRQRSRPGCHRTDTGPAGAGQVVAGYSRLLAGDLAVALLATPELSELLHGHEHVAGL